MKKSILLIALMAIVSISFAQVKAPEKHGIKKDTAAAVKKPVVKPKPEYKVDQAKIYHINLDVTAAEVSQLTMSPDEWKEVKRSSQLSGQQITDAEDNADDLRKSIRKQLNNLMLLDYQKFKADTTTAAKKLKPNH